MRRSIILTIGTVLTIGALLCWAGARNAEAADPELKNDDCVKCHATIVHQVDEAGNKHKTEVACLECHDGTHPPGVEKGSLIPLCSTCHEGQPHFQLENCLGCHTNPHQPLNIVFGDNVKAACDTCHSEVILEINTHQSAHAEVDCSYCHDRHGFKPDCLDCHEPHMSGQQYAVCVTCHQVHSPLELAYGDEIPNSDCGACHSDIRTTLESGATKHAAFQCVYCHADKHGNVPECQSCHGTPHNEQMLSKFPTCNDCHQSAHNLLK